MRKAIEGIGKSDWRLSRRTLLSGAGSFSAGIAAPAILRTAAAAEPVRIGSG
jgi:hypothetical protein